MWGLCLAGLEAQVATVRGRIEVEGPANSSRAPLPGTVVWLMPVAGASSELAPAPPSPAANVRLVQRSKSFEPHILVVPAGTAVEFPNRDPFFHNVFSLFDGKRFDLGLYEAGSSRVVHFDRPGISYIFCNIHPEMSAVVITLATPLYGVANAEGQINVPNVPYGRYMLHVWSEGTGPESRQLPAREITIAESATTLGVIRVPSVQAQNVAHKNKYGRDYDAPTPDNPVYHQQP
jgi:plastocyanin